MLKKHIGALALCYNPVLVRDKPPSGDLICETGLLDPLIYKQLSLDKETSFT